MKINVNILKGFLVLGMMIFLFGFSKNRNQQRIQKNILIEYTNPNSVFITEEDVNNLLIVKNQPYRKKVKDSLVLNELEKVLNQHPMIAKAEVYQTVNKSLGIQITQREPLARVMGAESFYVDIEGDRMPLSRNYSARVPLLSGMDSLDLKQIYPLLTKIRQDEFFNKKITGISKNKKNDFILSLRSSSVQVNFGKITELDEKLKNFKAFYTKAYQENILDTYTMVNLKYTNQVVCTKKQT